MINQQFTFAVHIMTALAFHDEVMDSRALAASINTNPVVVRRLLAALRRARLVETLAGRNGGARLRRGADRISLLDIYQAVELQPIIAVNRRKAWRHCPVSCKMEQIMARVAESADRAVKDRLRRIKLEKLVRKIAR